MSLPYRTHLLLRSTSSTPNEWAAQHRTNANEKSLQRMCVGPFLYRASKQSTGGDSDSLAQRTGPRRFSFGFLSSINKTSVHVKWHAGGGRFSSATWTISQEEKGRGFHLTASGDLLWGPHMQQNPLFRGQKKSDVCAWNKPLNRESNLLDRCVLCPNSEQYFRCNPDRINRKTDLYSETNCTELRRRPCFQSPPFIMFSSMLQFLRL